MSLQLFQLFQSTKYTKLPETDPNPGHNPIPDPNPKPDPKPTAAIDSC
jgi:hypothetical protein